MSAIDRLDEGDVGAVVQDRDRVGSGAVVERKAKRVLDARRHRKVSRRARERETGRDKRDR